MSDWEQLLEAFLSGEVTVEEREELARRALSDQSLRNEVFALAELEGLLRIEYSCDARRERLRLRVIERVKHHGCDASPDALAGEMEEIVRDRLSRGRLRERQRRRKASERRQSAPRWRWVASVAACLAIIAGALVYNQWRSTQFAEVLVAHIKATAPDVRIIRRGEAIIAVVDTGVFVGDRIKTGPGRNATFTYENEKTEILIEENTTLDIGGVKKGKRLDLHFGAIDVDVAPQPTGRPMVAATLQAKAEVKGTRFRLAVGSGSGLGEGKETAHVTRIDVYEGLVRFTRLDDGKAVDVAAGRHAVAGEGFPLAALPITNEEIAPPGGGRQDEAAVPEGRAVLSWKWDFDEGMPPGGIETIEESGPSRWERRRISGRDRGVLVADGDDAFLMILPQPLRGRPVIVDVTFVPSRRSAIVAELFLADGKKRISGFRARKRIDDHGVWEGEPGRYRYLVYDRYVCSLWRDGSVGSVYQYARPYQGDAMFLWCAYVMVSRIEMRETTSEEAKKLVGGPEALMKLLEWIPIPPPGKKEN